MAAERSIQLLVVGVAWPPETFLMRLLEGISRNGVTVTVASSQKPAQSWLEEGERSWLPAPGWDIPAWERAAKMAKMLAGYPQLPGNRRAILRRCIERIPERSNQVKAMYKYYPLAQQTWDVIYFPWNITANTYLPYLRQDPVKVIISCRGAQINVAPHNPKRVGIIVDYRAAFQRATKVHCVSEEILNEARSYGLDPTKAHVIRPAVDPAFFVPGPARMTRPPFKVVTTGSLIWRKGYEYALMSIQQLIHQGIDTEYHIVGDGPEWQRISFTIRDLGLEGRVFLHGKLPPIQVRELLQTSDAFLLSSLSEGISNAVLEAMSCGLPVVTSDCGGMREAVTDGLEGFIVPVREPVALTDALRRLAENETMRREMGCAGRERAMRAFSLEQQVQAFTRMIREAV